MDRRANSINVRGKVLFCEIAREVGVIYPIIYVGKLICIIYASYTVEDKRIYFYYTRKYVKLWILEKTICRSHTLIQWIAKPKRILDLENTQIFTSIPQELERVDSSCQHPWRKTFQLLFQNVQLLSNIRENFSLLKMYIKTIVAIFLLK